AYMTLGKYPQGVPGKWLVPGLDRDPEPESFQAFTDVAPQLGLSTKDLSGGVIVDDFNNDGYLDIVTSSYDLKQSMHYFRNDGRGGFSDQSASSNLGLFTGGLNITQTDYNNDGYLDIFVLRGGWQENFGEQPNSLLRNNGDDTFTDVTEESGLLSFYPTQTCAWRDFNNDGWLDLFIGNESTEPKLRFPCELYLNNRNGTFKEVAAEAGCAVIDFVKGVAAGDYDNDGREDLYLSSAHGNQMLLKNTGNNQGIPRFKNVTREAGLDDIRIRTFPTWFWDYNNDGWLDIFVCGYSFGKSIAHSACTEALQIENTAGKMYLYRNEGNGRFTNVSHQAGLDRTAFAMGSNFGDFDNDGFLDMYLGTGNPEYEALVPNRLFRNDGKGGFKDLSVAARVGNLQKGHGVAISDIDHDGDQDIFIEVGGVLPGDIYHSSLYLNPGQNQNSWIHILLEGEDTNKPAVGSRIKISITENGIPRSIYRDVNSGGSFGSSSYRRDIGLGRATIIDTLAITWHKSRQTRYFYSVPVNQIIRIREKETQYSQIPVNTLRFLGDSSKIPMCNLPAI
ncbi:MAG TPA: CRTAC1 family protein, partial [Saprospiraceae bacterium]|nr:CRTAC1 family protein [Saprospiraceae bacterium]